jgi:hypothetical protein
MKNIHILPTDKPSRFQKTKHDNFFLASKIELYTDCIGQHIYITNNEKIKEGDWTFDGENPYKWTSGDNEDCLYNSSSENYKGFKKIILTTDEDLIKDGVQAIDDEFLEWFCKNSSCEFVDVKLHSFGECHFNDCSCFDFAVQKVCVFYYPDYKIIIPKEEPKQETMTNYRLEGLERKAKEVAQELKEGGLLGGDLEVIGALLFLQYQGEDKRISELLTNINRVRKEAEELLKTVKQQEQ